MIINQEIILIIIFIVIVYITYLNNKINKLEQKSLEEFTITEETKTEIKTQIKQIYLADVEAIRILSNFAIQLSQGGFTVPGPITFNDRVNFKQKVFTENALALNGKKLYIRGEDGANKETGMDENHYIQSSGNDKYLNTTNVIDGVRICGNQGGVLSTNQGGLKDILWWNNDSINVRKINIVNAKGTTVLSIVGGDENSGMATIEGDINSFGRIKCAGLWPRSSKTDAHSMGNPFDTRGCLIGWDSDDQIFLQAYKGCKFQSTENDKINILGTWNADILNVNTNAKLNVVGLAGYYWNLENDQKKTIRPIICSMSRVEMNDVEDYFIINPGYRVELYKDGNYQNKYENYDNTTGIYARTFNDSNNNNQMYSYRVFFNNVEVRIEGIP